MRRLQCSAELQALRSVAPTLLMLDGEASESDFDDGDHDDFSDDGEHYDDSHEGDAPVPPAPKLKIGIDMSNGDAPVYV
jgi:hypothetical protein